MLIGPQVPLVLLVMLGGSCAAFWMVVRRWTVQRRWAELGEWASSNRFKLCGEERAVRPAALERFTQGARVLLSLAEDETAIVQVEFAAGQTSRRNLLVRTMHSANWPLTALRPASQPSSVIDLLPQAEFRSINHGERFIAYSASSAAAAALGKSSARALLPADVALILERDSLVLDFSTRPFDPLELSRMDSLAEQLVGHLPAMGNVKT
jgi:hypothetical protein